MPDPVAEQKTDDCTSLNATGKDLTAQSADSLILERDRIDHIRKKRAPGLPESVAWISLFLILQIAAMFAVLAVAILVTTGDPAALENFNLDAWLSTIDQTTKLVVFTSPAFLCYVFLVPAGLLRLAPRPAARLNLNLPTIGQTVVLASLVLPLTMVADAAMRQLIPIWEFVLPHVPALSFLNDMDVHTMIGSFDQASFGLAIFFLAVVPAVGEEFLFRGLLGRGLVARWGLFFGVGLTSFFFAAVHMYPPHVIAILPVGIALHWIYLTTKSFWAPVLFHFLNNSIAVLLMRAPQGESSVHWSIIACSIVYFLWSMFWLSKMRTVYQSENADRVSDILTVEVPQREDFTRMSTTHVAPVIVGMIVLITSCALIYNAL